MKYTDHEIIKCLSEGRNDKILEYLYNGIYPKIKSYVRKNNGNEDDALDIFQDAMVILCRQIKIGRYDMQHEISGFLYSVCRNIWINKVKKDKRMVHLAENADSKEYYDFTNDIITDQKSKILKEVIARLGEKCFKLLQLSIYNDLPGTEICNIMGFTSVDAVKTQKYKCKQKLIELLELHPIVREVIE